MLWNVPPRFFLEGVVGLEEVVGLELSSSVLFSGVAGTYKKQILKLKVFKNNPYPFKVACRTPILKTPKSNNNNYYP